jgi:hypothetical protein
LADFIEASKGFTVFIAFERRNILFTTGHWWAIRIAYHTTPTVMLALVICVGEGKSNCSLFVISAANMEQVLNTFDKITMPTSPCTVHGELGKYKCIQRC